MRKLLARLGCAVQTWQHLQIHLNNYFVSLNFLRVICRQQAQPPTTSVMKLFLISPQTKSNINVKDD